MLLHILTRFNLRLFLFNKRKRKCCHIIGDIKPFNIFIDKNITKPSDHET